MWSSDDEDEFEQYRARSYSGGFSPSLHRRPMTAGPGQGQCQRPRSATAVAAAPRRGRRLDDQEVVAGDDYTNDDDDDNDGRGRFTAAEQFIQSSPIRPTTAVS